MSIVFHFFVAVLLLVIAKSLLRLIVGRQSPLNRLRGPLNESLIFGHVKLLEAGYPSLHTKWFEEYGSTMRRAHGWYPERKWVAKLSSTILTYCSAAGSPAVHN